VKEIRNLDLVLPEEELNELSEEANVAIGRLMAGFVGRRDWDDDVMTLYSTPYDEICGNGFEVNLYNAATMPLGLFPYRQGSTSWREATSWVWDTEEFREIADALRANCRTRAGRLRENVERLTRSRSLAAPNGPRVPRALLLPTQAEGADGRTLAGHDPRCC
jgi:hypothetical protein